MPPVTTTFNPPPEPRRLFESLNSLTSDGIVGVSTKSVYVPDSATGDSPPRFATSFSGNPFASPPSSVPPVTAYFMPRDPLTSVKSLTSDGIVGVSTKSVYAPVTATEENEGTSVKSV